MLLNFQERWDAPPVDLTIKNIFLGRPHSLEPYRSLSSKHALLNAAINLGDGNAILEVREVSYDILSIKLVCSSVKQMFVFLSGCFVPCADIKKKFGASDISG